MSLGEHGVNMAVNNCFSWIVATKKVVSNFYGRMKGNKHRFTIEGMRGKQAACRALLAEEQRMLLCRLMFRCFHFRSLSVSSAWCLVFLNFVRLHRSLVCLFLLHSLSRGLVDKREAREEGNGNEHRAQAVSDGMEKERKGKPEVAS